MTSNAIYWTIAAAVPFVGLLIQVIRWAVQRRRSRQQKDRESAHARCAHGARIFGVNCQKCLDDVAAEFAEFPKDEWKVEVNTKDDPWVYGTLQQVWNKIKVNADQPLKWGPGGINLDPPLDSGLRPRDMYYGTQELRVYGTPFKPGQWIRIKDFGVWNGRLAQVQGIYGQAIHLKHESGAPYPSGHDPHSGQFPLKVAERAAPRPGEWWQWTTDYAITKEPFLWTESALDALDFSKFVAEGALVPVNYGRGNW